MILFVTVCTIRQIPQALILGESIRRCHPNDLFLIGLADHPNHVPTLFKSPYPLLSVNDLPLPNREQLSQHYTSAEFTAACKPLFIRQAGSVHPEAERIVYLDPTIELYQPLTELTTLYADYAILLTPYLLRSPADKAFPDEKYFQNVGLYNSGFLALKRSAEADRFLAWWGDRVPERAFIDFCQGLCTDQIWLALVPGLFDGVGICKLPGWHVGLWNVHERVPKQSASQLPLVFFNFKGLTDQEGFFVAQDRISLNDYPAIKQRLADYQRRLKEADKYAFAAVNPAFGQQPTKLPLMGWRKKATETLQETVRFIDTVDVPRKM